jgi:hypothetical protein
VSLEVTRKPPQGHGGLALSCCRLISQYLELGWGPTCNLASGELGPNLGTWPLALYPLSIEQSPRTHLCPEMPLFLRTDGKLEFRIVFFLIGFGARLTLSLSLSLSLSLPLPLPLCPYLA